MKWRRSPERMADHPGAVGQEKPGPLHSSGCYCRDGRTRQAPFLSSSLPCPSPPLLATTSTGLRPVNPVGLPRTSIFCVLQTEEQYSRKRKGGAPSIRAEEVERVKDHGADGQASPGIRAQTRTTPRKQAGKWVLGATQTSPAVGQSPRKRVRTKFPLDLTAPHYSWFT